MAPLSLPLRERKGFLGFSLFAKSLENPSEGIIEIRTDVPPRMRRFAREMRKDATLPEHLLWQVLRNKQLNGLKFRRQVPCDDYILDFVCLEARLIIEIDGSQHSCSQSDVDRDTHFQRRGFKTVRFWNGDILNNLDDVCMHILHEAGVRR